MTIVAARKWVNNGELIADVAQLYFPEHPIIVDTTWGRGNWWTHYRPGAPGQLIGHDLHTLDGIDFRDLPEPDDYADVVAYDPPYVAVGGRNTSTLGDFNDRYGLHHTPTTPEGLQELIVAGLAETYRILKPARSKRDRPPVALVKCKDYIWSGRYWPGAHHTLTAALNLGFALIDRFEHIGVPGPQPGGRRQLHARRNVSTLFVLAKPATAPHLFEMRGGTR
jgi:hypothetical protein